jgi:hypothetical protein
MSKFLVIADDDYKAFVNPDLITMFRVKRAADGSYPDDGEVEIEFIGGSSKKLFGDPAKHFLAALSKTINWQR